MLRLSSTLICYAYMLYTHAATHICNTYLLGAGSATCVGARWAWARTDGAARAEQGHIVTRHGKMSFVDLAGSERLKDSKSEGTTLRETGSINKSLFTLGKVMLSWY
eukprot:2831553-Rhodomonas_salina.1